jgi:hypothetical protein
MTSSDWLEYFRSNRNAGGLLPWQISDRLTAQERACVGASVQQFQLGEGSAGAGFLRRGAVFARRIGDSDFVPALELFIQEEQRHSGWLGRFLDLEGIPRIQKHWVDGVFRRLRSLAGLELCVAVLVAAEAIAVPYYRALRGATKSPLLRAICNHILHDEEAHLGYQGRTLLLMGPGNVKRWAQRAFLCVTIGLVWVEHRSVFAAGGYEFGRFFRETFEAFVCVENATAPGFATADACRSRVRD